MIISASRRTDIPACYSDWFMNRIRDGHVCVRNPFNTGQVTCVDLDPDKVDCIVFWTKDAEHGVRPKPEIEETLIGLSKEIGRDRQFSGFVSAAFGEEAAGIDAG